MPPWAPALQAFAQQQVAGYIQALANFLVAQGCRVSPWDATQIAHDAVDKAQTREKSQTTCPDTAYLKGLKEAKDILGSAAAGYTWGTDPSIQVLGWYYKFELVCLGQGPESEQTYKLLRESDLNRRLMAWFLKKLAKPYRNQAYILVLDVWSRLWEAMARCCYSCDRPVDRYVFGIANFVFLGFLTQTNPGPQPLLAEPADDRYDEDPSIVAHLRRTAGQMAVHLIEGLRELTDHNAKWYRATVLYLLAFGIKHIANINDVTLGPAAVQEEKGRDWLDGYLHRRGWDDPSARRALLNYLHECGFQGLWSFLFPALPDRIAAPPSHASCAKEKRDVLNVYASLDRDEFVVFFYATTGLDQASIAGLIGEDPSAVASWLSSGWSKAVSWMQGKGWSSAANLLQYILDHGLDRYLE